MEKEIIKDTIEDGVCSGENKDNEGKKKPRKKRLQRFRNQLLGRLYKSLDTRL